MAMRHELKWFICELDDLRKGDEHPAYTSILSFEVSLLFSRATLCYSAGTSGHVSVCVCLSQVGVLSKQLNESGWFWAWELPSIYILQLVIGKFRCIQKQGYFSLELCCEL